MSHEPASVVVLIDVADLRGRPVFRQRLELDPGQRTITIGRSPKADVVLDDEHAAAVHASLEVGPGGGLQVSDLGSFNGIVVAGQRLRGATALPLPDRSLQIGRSRLKVRTSLDVEPPEKSDAGVGAAALLSHPAWIATAAGLVVAAQLSYGAWLQAPRDLATSIVGNVFNPMLMVAVAWVAMWSLLSRIIQGEWRLWRHAAIILGVWAVYGATVGVLNLLWFMIARPGWSERSQWLAGIAVVATLYLHLMNASTLTSRRAATLSLAVPLVIGACSYWLYQRAERQNVGNIPAGIRIYPPALRLASGEPLDQYFKRLATLRAAADWRRKAAQDENPEVDEE